mgnify:CR=1 FL=1
MLLIPPVMRSQRKRCEMVSRMVGWGRKHGIEAGGRVYANDMTSFFDEDGATFCLELYMPVRKIVSQI